MIQRRCSLHVYFVLCQARDCSEHVAVDMLLVILSFNSFELNPTQDASLLPVFIILLIVFKHGLIWVALYATEIALLN